MCSSAAHVRSGLLSDIAARIIVHVDFRHVDQPQLIVDHKYLTITVLCHEQCVGVSRPRTPPYLRENRCPVEPFAHECLYET